MAKSVNYPLKYIQNFLVLNLLLVYLDNQQFRNKRQSNLKIFKISVVIISAVKTSDELKCLLTPIGGEMSS